MADCTYGNRSRDRTEEGKVGKTGDSRGAERRKKRSTPEAQKLYEILLKMGFNAKLELWDGHKHIDIAIPDYMVNIEVDGKQHQSKKQALADLKRTYHSFKKDYVTLRIPNILVQEDTLFETASYIKRFLNESEAQLNEGLEDENFDDDW